MRVSLLVRDLTNGTRGGGHHVDGRVIRVVVTHLEYRQNDTSTNLASPFEGMPELHEVLTCGALRSLSCRLKGSFKPTDTTLLVER